MNPALLLDALCNIPFTITEVVCGKASGADTLGERWAIWNNISVKEFPAEWNRLGKSAGFIRNVAMAHYANALIALWDGTSRGTKHMISTMEKLQKPVYVFPYHK